MDCVFEREKGLRTTVSQKTRMRAQMGFDGYGYSRKTRGYATRAWVCLQKQLRNLATAVQVSIDTAVHIARLTI